jgi:hypothetical protein
MHHSAITVIPEGYRKRSNQVQINHHTAMCKAANHRRHASL